MLKLEISWTPWRGVGLFSIERAFIRRSLITQLNTRVRMPTWIPILRPLRPITSNKTQNNETGRSLYWADLVPRSGSEQRGRRPVIVISHDAFNQTQGWRSIIVVPLSTSAAQAGRGPSAVLLSQGAAGLDRDSVALCHQVTTLDRSKLTQRMGELNSAELRQVEDGIKAAMDLR